MSLSTYPELRASILAWLARPGDPLVDPAVPDFIALFEAEANRRLKHARAEKRAYMTVTGTAVVPLPGDFTEMRMVALSDGRELRYVPPTQLPGEGGETAFYTIVGTELLLGPGPNGTTTVYMTYQSGVPPLTDVSPVNWLLQAAPDLYLFGSLCMAEPYIGHDERLQIWVQAREAAFEAMRQADIKARWPGGLQIRLDGSPVGTAGHIGSGAMAVPAPAPPGALVSDAAPSNPTRGTLWWNSSDVPGTGGGQLYVWFIDPGGIGAWVAASNEPEA
jgi:hypothetical protein